MGHTRAIWTPRLGRIAAIIVTGALAAAAIGCTSDDETSGDGGSPAPAMVASPFDGTYEATIARTTDGVPHITGANIESVLYGQGYASGEDYACTLADQILKVTSQRAAFEGPGEDDANVASDFAWKAIGIDEIARADYPGQTDQVKAQMTAFTAGWNAYLADVGPDGVTGWCVGADWLVPITPEDLYSYVRSIALNASSMQLLNYLGSAQPPVASPATVDGPAGSDGSAGSATLIPPTATDPGTNLGTNPGTTLDTAGRPDDVGPGRETAPIASNGWAIGTERSTDGGGLLLANPHFPWEGQLRFWENHLIVPGEVNIYGAQLTGTPGIGIGFTDEFAWTHTVSAGNRFTAYTLDLVPGTPTSYLVDGIETPMTSKPAAVEVLQPDGSTVTEQRTLWSTEYGPVLDFPGVGWTTEMTTTYRDANIDNDEFIDQYLAMQDAGSFDEFTQAFADHQAVPLFNTVAVSKDGRAWYADVSATPNLSDAALAKYDESIAAGGLAAIAARSGAVLLDGSDSTFRWVDDPGARDPGLVPYDRMPQTERADYVFNANDSFWLNNASTVLEGDYSPLHGRQGTPRTPRTRQNATVLGDTSAAGGSGDDAAFDLAELQALALDNEAFTATSLKDAVVERCQASPLVEVPELVDEEDGTVALPAESVDLTEACRLLAAWDTTFDLDSVGAVIWRELDSRYTPQDLLDAGVLWANAFDPTDPVNTPSGLAPAPPGGPDPTLVNLGRAVQIITKAGFDLDTPLGEVQVANRNGTMVPINGGTNADGTTNIVGYSASTGSTEPFPRRPEPVAPKSALTPDGYLITSGSSFLMAVQFTPDGPVAQGLVTYGSTGDRESPLFVVQTQRFSDKSWRSFLFSPDAIAADPELTTKTVGSA